MNYNEQINIIGDFLKNVLKKAGLSKYIIGLSGGIDSAVSAYLAVKAIGKENVIGLMLPYKNSSPDSLTDAVLVAESLDIDYYTVNITGMVDYYFNTYEKAANSLRKGNFMARMRMSVLYDYSSKYNALVLGTGNKSELLTGYCTQYGDSACACEPLGHLYKTDVWELAKVLGVPEKVIIKQPTADLWDGQTDEEEMGLSYKKLDEILKLVYDEKLSDDAILAQNYNIIELNRVKSLIAKSEFKRNLPPALEELK